MAKSTLAFGDTLEFSIELTALRDESLMIDYTIDFMKAGGKRAKKVFKAAKLVLKKGQSQFVSKRINCWPRPPLIGFIQANIT